MANNQITKYYNKEINKLQVNYDDLNTRYERQIEINVRLSEELDKLTMNTFSRNFLCWCCKIFLAASLCINAIQFIKLPL